MRAVILVTAADPLTTAELQFAQEAARTLGATCLALFPLGSDYASIDVAAGGLLPFSRLVLTYLAAHGVQGSTLRLVLPDPDGFWEQPSAPALRDFLVHLREVHGAASAVVVTALRPGSHAPASRCLAALLDARSEWDPAGAVEAAYVLTSSVLLGAPACSSASGGLSLLPIAAAASPSAGHAFTPTYAGLETSIRTPQQELLAVAQARLTAGLLRTGSPAALLACIVPPVVAQVIARYGLYRQLQVGDAVALSPAERAALAAAGETASSPLFGWHAERTHLPPVPLDGSRSGAVAAAAPAAHVAVLGGSFNPPTAAHVSLAAYLATQRALPLSQVWVVPCGRRADKASPAASPAHRHIMTLAAVEGELGGGGAAGVYVVPLELREAGALASYDLMSRLRTAPAAAVSAPTSSSGPVAIHLAIGADLLPQLSSWRHAQALLREVAFLALPRPATDAPAAVLEEGQVLPANLTHLDSDGSSESGFPPPPALALSSTEVRARLAAVGPSSCVGLLPPPVLAHLALAPLYATAGVSV